jgi:hypothetical protein
MSNYVPPGVEVTEVLASPTISPIIASASDVVLVGPALGYQVHSEKVTLTTPGTSIKLPFLAALNSSSPGSATLVKVGSASAIVSVTNYVTPQSSPYAETTDFTVNTSGGSIAIAASGSTIPNNTVVYVTYTWIPNNYYYPQRFENIGSIAATYGNALDSTGSSISSPLTFAAGLCLGNGAGSVILQPLFENETDPPGATTPKLQPTSNVSTTPWADTLELALGFIEGADLVVPIVGQSYAGGSNSTQLAVYQQVQKYLVSLRNNEEYCMAIFGDDSSTSTSVGQESTLQSNATTLKSSFGGTLNQQMIYVNTSKFQVALPASSASTPLTQLTVGGQYMAAAVAGAIAGRPISSAITRKSIGGFSGVLDPRTTANKNADAEKGLLVIEQKGENIRCRHGITLDSTSAARSEISVVRAKFNLIASVKETLENEVIGQIIADANSPFVVRSAIAGVLSALHSRGSILDYSQIHAEISSINPTAIKASFAYRPAFTLNYINVEFSLDLSAQTVTAGEPV